MEIGRNIVEQVKFESNGQVGANVSEALTQKD